MRVICVAGARPNYMKVKPVMDALEERGAEVILVHTGLHYDAAMSDVVGDVNSTLACALVTAKLGAPLAHVEAGLRCDNRSMPEEINRLVTDRVSAYLFAPSPDAVANLRAEGFAAEQIHLVGNVMADILLANVGRAAARRTLAELGLRPGQYGLVTLHRPANVDNPAVLASLLPALAEISRGCPLELPVHPRAAASLRDAWLPVSVRMIPPTGYLDFIALEASARLVLTDSGGVQEETTLLGVPCLTLRDNTERPITITEGTNRLVGRDLVTETRVRLGPGGRPTQQCPRGSDEGMYRLARNKKHYRALAQHRAHPW